MYKTKAEVLKELSVSNSTLGRMVQAGSFPKPTKIGRSFRWNIQTVERWIDKTESEQHGNLVWHLGRTFG